MKICSIEKHGLPDMEKLTGRVAFIWDGCIVSGWPLYPEHSHDKGDWEGNDDVARPGKFRGVTTYIIFDKPMWDYEKNTNS
jgi:hypothetical protein